MWEASHARSKRAADLIDVAKLAGRCPLYLRVHRRRREKAREPLGVIAPAARLTSCEWTDAG
jgi:hypothetical protein